MSEVKFGKEFLNKTEQFHSLMGQIFLPVIEYYDTLPSDVFSPGYQLDYEDRNSFPKGFQVKDFPEEDIETECNNISIYATWPRSREEFGSLSIITGYQQGQLSGNDWFVRADGGDRSKGFVWNPKTGIVNPAIDVDLYLHNRQLNNPFYPPNHLVSALSTGHTSVLRNPGMLSLAMSEERRFQNRRITLAIDGDSDDVSLLESYLAEMKEALEKGYGISSGRLISEEEQKQVEGVLRGKALENCVCNCGDISVIASIQPVARGIPLISYFKLYSHDERRNVVTTVPVVNKRTESRAGFAVLKSEEDEIYYPRFLATEFYLKLIKALGKKQRET
jgi:hypothetical protein